MNAAKLKQKEIGLTPQCYAIWQGLKRGFVIDGLSALQAYGTMKLATRVGEIQRDLGVEINKEWHKLANGKRIKRYSYTGKIR